MKHACPYISPLQILELAARESQDAVDDALRCQIAASDPIDVDAIVFLVQDASQIPPATDVDVEQPCLADYDSLLQHPDMESLPDGEDDQDQQRASDISEAHGFRTAGGQAENEPPRQPERTTDGPVSRTSSAELSRSLPAGSSTGDDGEAQSPGLPFGTNDARMSIASGGSHCAAVSC